MKVSELKEKHFEKKEIFRIVVYSNGAVGVKEKGKPIDGITAINFTCKVGEIPQLKMSKFIYKGEIQK